MKLYVIFETEQLEEWCEKPWDCKIETLGPVYLKGQENLQADSPEVLKCIRIGTRILLAMIKVVKNNGILAEVELSDEEFNDICNVDRSKARLEYQGIDTEGRHYALLKYPYLRN